MEKNNYLISIKKKKYKYFLLLIIFILVIEIFLCNYPAFRTLLTGNNEQEVSYKIEDNKIIISEVGVRVTSINFEYKNDFKNIVTYKVAFLAKEDDRLVELQDKAILPNNLHYVQFDTHSICEKIEVEIISDSNVEISKIFVNRVNFNINYARMILLFLIGILTFVLKDEYIWNKVYNPDSKKQHYIFLIVLTIFSSIISIYVIKQYDLPVKLYTKDKIGTFDTLILQTEAFMKTEVALPIKPSQLLVNFDEPYNYTLKEEEDIPFLFDTAYYNGAYYSYFGVAPIFLLILPFRIITGKYIDTHILNLVFVILALYFLYEVYRKFIKKYVKKVSLCSFYLGYFTLVMGSDILFTLRGQRYDIVVITGIMLILFSISLAISIGENENYRNLKYVILGIAMALIVLSKPTFILYFPLIVFFLWTSIKNFEKKEKIKIIVLIVIPLIIFGIWQMNYNYQRFDNPFEFGAKYQLTAFNMLYSMSFSLVKVYEGIIDCIFRMPSINLLKFPFITLSKDVSHVMINELVYENRTIGLMAIPIFYIFLFKKYILNKDDIEFKRFINLSWIITFIIIIINSCVAGICNLYTIDFKVILAINAIILLLKNLEKNEYSKQSNYKFSLLCIATICIMIPISFSTGIFMLEDFSSSLTIYLKNIFEFWC